MKYLKDTRVVAILLFVIVAVMYGFRVVGRESHDLAVLLYAGNLILEGAGDKIYSASPDIYLYAPWFTFIMAPFAMLPAKMAAVIWYFLKILSLFGTMYIIHENLDMRRGRVAAVSLSFLLVLKFWSRSVEYGQVNELILFMLLLAFHLGRKGRLYVSGGLVAACSLLKFFPGLLILYFLFRRQWKALGGAVVAGVLLLLLPSIYYGFGLNLDMIVQWLEQLGVKGLPVYSHNQSLAAVLVRYLSDTEFLLFASSTTVKWNIADFRRSTLMIAALLFNIIGAFACIWISRVRKFPDFLEYSILCALMFLVPHLIWKPYFLFLFPLWGIVFSIWTSAGRIKRIVIALLAGVTVLVNQEIIGKRAADVIESLSVWYLVAVMLLVFVVVHSVLKEDADA